MRRLTDRCHLALDWVQCASSGRLCSSTCYGCSNARCGKSVSLFKQLNPRDALLTFVHVYLCSGDDSSDYCRHSEASTETILMLVMHAVAPSHAAAISCYRHVIH